MLGRQPISTAPICVVDVVETGDVLQLSVRDLSAPEYVVLDRSTGDGVIVPLPDMMSESPSQERYRVTDISGPSVFVS